MATQLRSGRRPPSLRGPTASEVLPRLFLTDIFTAHDEAQLTSLGITHVISVIECAPTLSQTRSLHMLHIPLSDKPNEDILTHFPVATSFIGNALAEDPNSRVLVSFWWLLRPFPCSQSDPFFHFIQVHCFMGISRSAAIVCAYLIATMRMTPDEALAAVKQKRGIVSPNIGFLRQLEEYSKRLHGESGKPLAEVTRDTTSNDPNPRPASTAGDSPSSVLTSSRLAD
jgi:atypical dual specificity phosphatase